MGLDYKNLDERTRTLMLAEIEQDIAGETLFSVRGVSEHAA